MTLTLLVPLPADAHAGLAHWRYVLPFLAMVLAYALVWVAVFDGPGG